MIHRHPSGSMFFPFLMPARPGGGGVLQFHIKQENNTMVNTSNWPYNKINKTSFNVVPLAKDYNVYNSETQFVAM
jgi:hypothetical protein